MKKCQKCSNKNASNYNTEIILKLDRIEAELEIMKVPLLLNNKQITRLKESFEYIQKKLIKTETSIQ